MEQTDSTILAALAHLPTERRPDPLDLIRCVSRRDLIAALGIGKRTFERLEAVGDIPVLTQLSPNRTAFRLVEVARWLDKRCKPAGEAKSIPACAAGNGARHIGS